MQQLSGAFRSLHAAFTPPSGIGTSSDGRCMRLVDALFLAHAAALGYEQAALRDLPLLDGLNLLEGLRRRRLLGVGDRELRHGGLRVPREGEGTAGASQRARRGEENVSTIVHSLKEDV